MRNRRKAMSPRYQPSPRPIRVVAAVVAFMTVVMLFDFVAGLGDVTAAGSLQAVATQRAVAMVEAPAGDAAVVVR
jgi:hypothetical protein